MKEILRLYVRGTPEPQPRPRARIVPTGHGKPAHVHIYDAESYPRDDPQGRGGRKLPWILWKEKIIREVKSAYPHAPTTRPVWLQLDFFFPRPDRLMKKTSPANAVPHISRPDLDNLIKLVKDALTGDGDQWQGVWKDDGQVFRYPEASKHYVKQGDAPGVFIIVEEDEEAEVALFDKTPAPAKIEQPAKPSKYSVNQTVNWASPNGQFEGVVRAIHGEVGELLTVETLDLPPITIQVDSFIHDVKDGRLPRPPLQPGRPNSPLAEQQRQLQAMRGKL